MAEALESLADLAADIQRATDIEETVETLIPKRMVPKKSLKLANDFSTRFRNANPRAFAVIMLALTAFGRWLVLFDVYTDIDFALIVKDCASHGTAPNWSPWVVLAFVAMPYCVCGSMFCWRYLHEKEYLKMSLSFFIMSSFIWMPFAGGFVVIMDILLATLYVPTKMDNTKYLLYILRLRLLTEACLEALPTAVVQLIVIFSNEQCFTESSDLKWAYASVFISLISLLKNYYVLKRDARMHGVSLRKFLGMVFKAGMGTIPYVAAMRANNIDHVKYIGIALNTREVQAIADVAIESNSVRTVQIDKIAVDVRSLRGSTESVEIEIDLTGAKSNDIRFISALLLQNVVVRSVKFTGTFDATEGLACARLGSLERRATGSTFKRLERLDKTWVNYLNRFKKVHSRRNASSGASIV